MRNGEQIRAALFKFVGRWQTYAGTERSEAQTFLNELFECYGRNRKDAGAIFEDAHSSTAIMDLHLPGLLIVEMKAPKESLRLDQHRTQALDYWHNSADVAAGRPAPQFVVLCSFHRFEIWEPGKYPNASLLAFSLEELPDRYESLMVREPPPSRGRWMTSSSRAFEEVEAYGVELCPTPIRNLAQATVATGADRAKRWALSHCPWASRPVLNCQ